MTSAVRRHRNKRRIDERKRKIVDTPIVTAVESFPVQLRRSDCRMIKRAVIEGWPVPDASRKVIVKRLADALDSDNIRLSGTACGTLIDMAGLDAIRNVAGQPSLWDLNEVQH